MPFGATTSCRVQGSPCSLQPCRGRPRKLRKFRRILASQIPRLRHSRFATTPGDHGSRRHPGSPTRYCGHPQQLNHCTHPELSILPSFGSMQVCEVQPQLNGNASDATRADRSVRSYANLELFTFSGRCCIHPTQDGVWKSLAEQTQVRTSSVPTPSSTDMGDFEISEQHQNERNTPLPRCKVKPLRALLSLHVIAGHTSR